MYQHVVIQKDFGSATSHNRKLFYCIVWSTKMIRHEIYNNQAKLEKMANPKPFTKMTIQIEEDNRQRDGKKSCGGLLLKACVNDVKYSQ